MLFIAAVAPAPCRSYGSLGAAAGRRGWRGGMMSRVGFSLASALLLGGCTSWSVSSWMPSFDVGGGGGGGTELRLDSEPPGAEARTSTGQACRTPCVLAVPAADQTVTFTLAGFLPQAVPLQVRLPSDPRWDPNAVAGAQLTPNPVAVALEPAPPPVAARKPPPKKRRATPPPRPPA
jgi:hypothetical protein